MKRGRRRLVRLGLALICSMVILSRASGQSDSSSITGLVRDPSGAMVPGAQVTVSSEATGESRGVTADRNGYYSVPSLAAGLYMVTVRTAGFKLFESVHNQLDAASTLSLNAVLVIGTPEESVKVTATAEVIQTDSGAVEHLITGEQVQHQELNGRNPVYMAEMLPGMITGSTLGDFNFGVSNPGYSVNGARSGDTVVMLDGAPATRTRANTYVVGVPNVDSTEEIQVLNASYAAEYGGAGGGQVRIVSKSGGGSLHGTAYEYLRNSALNANTWPRNEVAATQFTSPFRYNDFGFAAGGPAWIPGLPALHRRLFWFVAQDWIRYRFTDTQLLTVPTEAMRQGDFSELLGPNPFYAKPVVLTDPTRCTTTGGVTSCAPLANNVIPPSLMSPNGMAILAAYPHPTPGLLINGDQNWEAVAPHPINQRKGTYNADLILSDRQHISFRRSGLDYFEYSALDQGSGLTGKYKLWPNQANTLGWVWTITPTLVNELSATYSRDQISQPANLALAGWNRSNFGINYSYIVPGGKDLDKIPSLSLPGPFYSLSGGPYPSHSGGPIYSLSDRLSKAAGDHTLKFGFTYDYRGENDDDQINVSTVPGGSNNQNGAFTLTDGYAGGGGLALANLAMGRADAYTEIGPRAFTVWRSSMYEAFAEDSWKVTPRLHLDYGVRETFILPYHSLWGNAAFFDPALYNPAQAVTVDPKTGLVALGAGNQYDGMVIPGLGTFPADAVKNGVYQANFPQTYSSLFDPGLPRGLFNGMNALQPRLGAAYQITAKTVVRAGAGRFVTRMGLLDNIFPGGNSPFQPYVTVTGISIDNPGAGLNSMVGPTLTVTTLDRNLKQPEGWNWNLTVEQALPGHSVLSLAYVGRRGLHLWYSVDENQAPAGTTLLNPGVNIAALLPYPGFSKILMEVSHASSRYNALQAYWNRRFTNGLGFSAAYTWSRSMDNSSSYGDIAPDTYDVHNLWAPSTFDVRNNFVSTGSYDLPLLRAQRRLAGRLLGGWQLSVTAQYLSGSPQNIYTTNVDYAGAGDIGLPQFWVHTGSVRYPRQFGATAAATWFTTTNPDGSSIFTPPAPGTFNLQNGVRDSIYGPGFQDWNAGLFKNFPVNERHSFEFRSEAYDVFNHPNWSGPNLNPTSSTFGKVTSKSALSRNLQLSLRYTY